MSETKFYIVATPIGNLEDMSFRAVNVLKDVDLILAEDTRNTGKLLKHYGIQTAMQSFHGHNEHKVLEHYISKLVSGIRIALVSDAGTPGISDPGFLIIRELAKREIKYEVIPGATAFVPALLLSGFPCDKFIYEGFIPHKKGRQKLFESWLEEEKTVVFYESPHRLIKCLEQMIGILGEQREASISREITKKFEETIRGTLLELLIHFQNNAIKGEFVIVLKGAAT